MVNNLGKYFPHLLISLKDNGQFKRKIITMYYGGYTYIYVYRET